MLASTSDIGISLSDGHGPPTVCIKGRMSHLTGPLLPMAGQVPKFNHIYIHLSADAQLDRQMTSYNGVNRAMLREPQGILHSINPFVQHFKSARESAAAGDMS